MIVTVALNPSVDHYYQGKSLHLGSLNRVHRLDSYPGGKGINIAVMLGVLGADVVSTGLVGWSSSKFLQNKLSQYDIATEYVLTDAPTRNNMLLIDTETGTGTLLDETGPEIREEEVSSLVETYRRLVRKAEMVILAGSLPRGVSPDIYCTLAGIAQRERARVVINTQEEILQKTLSCNPWLIMPDTRGTDILMGRQVRDARELIGAANALLSTGGRIAVVTTDHKNYIVLTPEHCWECITPPVESRNILRSSDAMLAGMVYSLSKGADPSEAARWGAALSTSMRGYLGEFIHSKEEVENAMDQVVIKEILL